MPLPPKHWSDHICDTKFTLLEGNFFSPCFSYTIDTLLPFIVMLICLPLVLNKTRRLRARVTRSIDNIRRTARNEPFVDRILCVNEYIDSKIKNQRPERMENNTNVNSNKNIVNDYNPKLYYQTLSSYRSRVKDQIELSPLTPPPIYTAWYVFGIFFLFLAGIAPFSSTLLHLYINPQSDFKSWSDVPIILHFHAFVHFFLGFIALGYVLTDRARTPFTPAFTSNYHIYISTTTVLVTHLINICALLSRYGLSDNHLTYNMYPAFLSLVAFTASMICFVTQFSEYWLWLRILVISIVETGSDNTLFLKLMSSYHSKINYTPDSSINFSRPHPKQTLSKPSVTNGLSLPYVYNKTTNPNPTQQANETLDLLISDATTRNLKQVQQFQQSPTSVKATTSTIPTHRLLSYIGFHVPMLYISAEELDQYNQQLKSPDVPQSKKDSILKKLKNVTTRIDIPLQYPITSWLDFKKSILYDRGDGGYSYFLPDDVFSPPSLYATTDTQVYPIVAHGYSLQDIHKSTERRHWRMLQRIYKLSKKHNHLALKQFSFSPITGRYGDRDMVPQSSFNVNHNTSFAAGSQSNNTKSSSLTHIVANSTAFINSCDDMNSTALTTTNPISLNNTIKKGNKKITFELNAHSPPGQSYGNSLLPSLNRDTSSSSSSQHCNVEINNDALDSINNNDNNNTSTNPAMLSFATTSSSLYIPPSYLQNRKKIKYYEVRRHELLTVPSQDYCDDVDVDSDDDLDQYVYSYKPEPSDVIKSNQKSVTFDQNNVNFTSIGSKNNTSIIPRSNLDLYNANTGDINFDESNQIQEHNSTTPPPPQQQLIEHDNDHKPTTTGINIPFNYRTSNYINTTPSTSGSIMTDPPFQFIRSYKQVKYGLAPQLSSKSQVLREMETPWELHASSFQIPFFSWVSPLLDYGYKEIIDIHDLDVIAPYCSAQRLLMQADYSFIFRKYRRLQLQNIVKSLSTLHSTPGSLQEQIVKKATAAIHTSFDLPRDDLLALTSDSPHYTPDSPNGNINSVYDISFGLNGEDPSDGFYSQFSAEEITGGVNSPFSPHSRDSFNGEQPVFPTYSDATTLQQGEGAVDLFGNFTKRLIHKDYITVKTISDKYHRDEVQANMEKLESELERIDTLNMSTQDEATKKKIKKKAAKKAKKDEKAKQEAKQKQKQQNNPNEYTIPTDFGDNLQHVPGRYNVAITRSALYAMYWDLTGRRTKYGILLKLFADCFSYLPPIMLNLLLTFARKPDEAPFWGGPRGMYGYLIALVLVLTNWFEKILNQNSFHILAREGGRSRSLTMSMVYRKILSMSSIVRTTVGAGLLNNIITTDAMRTENIYWMGYYAITAPIQCTIAISLLIFYIGYSALIGVLVLLLMIPIQLAMSKYGTKLTNNNQTFTDKRIDGIVEALQGIKTIKMHNWETRFVELITNIRSVECRSLLVRQIWNGFQAMALQSAPSIVATGTFLMYIYSTGKPLTSKVAFTALPLFNILQTTLWALPWTVQYIVEFHVALGRIASLLSLPDKENALYTYEYRRTYALAQQDEAQVDIANSQYYSDEKISLLNSVLLSQNPGTTRLRHRNNTFEIISDRFSNVGYNNKHNDVENATITTIQNDDSGIDSNDRSKLLFTGLQSDTYNSDHDNNINTLGSLQPVDSFINSPTLANLYTQQPILPLNVNALHVVQNETTHIPIGEVRIINTDFWLTQYSSPQTTKAIITVPNAQFANSQTGFRGNNNYHGLYTMMSNNQQQFSFGNGQFSSPDETKIVVPLPTLHIPKLIMSQGSLTCIVGPIGSGKSLLLSCILGDIPSAPSLLAHIPDLIDDIVQPYDNDIPQNQKGKGSVKDERQLQQQSAIKQLQQQIFLTPISKRSFTHPLADICYIPQQAWIIAGTIRDNIILDSPYIPQLFLETIQACALDRDIAIMPEGDLTPIAERGSTLSGGQKQRISISRAVYRRHIASIFIFDSPLSALDSNVSQHIYQHVLGPNGLLKDKTRILVTHQLQWTKDADQIISMQATTTSQPVVQQFPIPSPLPSNNSTDLQPNNMKSNPIQPKEPHSQVKVQPGTIMCRIVEVGTFDELTQPVITTPTKLDTIETTESACQSSHNLLLSTAQSLFAPLDTSNGACAPSASTPTNDSSSSSSPDTSNGQTQSLEDGMTSDKVHETTTSSMLTQPAALTFYSMWQHVLVHQQQEHEATTNADNNNNNHEDNNNTTEINLTTTTKQHTTTSASSASDGDDDNELLFTGVAGAPMKYNDNNTNKIKGPFNTTTTTTDESDQDPIIIANSSNNNNTSHNRILASPHRPMGRKSINTNTIEPAGPRDIPLKTTQPPLQVDLRGKDKNKSKNKFDVLPHQHGVGLYSDSNNETALTRQFSPMSIKGGGLLLSQNSFVKSQRVGRQRVVTVTEADLSRVDTSDNLGLDDVDMASSLGSDIGSPSDVDSTTGDYYVLPDGMVSGIGIDGGPSIISDTSINAGSNLHHELTSLDSNASSLTRNESSILNVNDDNKDKKDKDDSAKKSGSIATTETRAKGEISWATYFYYLTTMNSLLATVCILFAVVQVALARYTDIWLTDWSSNTYHKSSLFYLWVYAGLQAITILITFLTNLFCAIAGVRASKYLHQSMLSAIFFSPLSFFDITPLGRISNRFSSDMASIDTTLPNAFFGWINLYIQIISFAIVIVLKLWYLIFLFIPIGIIFMYISANFRRSCRELRRLESTTRSPIFILVDQTIDGVESIHCYTQHLSYLSQFISIVDEHWRPRFLGQVLNRWLAVRLDMMGNVILLTLIFVLLTFDVHSPDANANGRDSASILGLLVSYALTMTGKLNWLVRNSVDTENQMNTIERCTEYCKLEPEWLGDPYSALNSQYVEYTKQPGKELLVANTITNTITDIVSHTQKTNPSTQSSIPTVITANGGYKYDLTLVKNGTVGQVLDHTTLVKNSYNSKSSRGDNNIKLTLLPSNILLPTQQFYTTQALISTFNASKLSPINIPSLWPRYGNIEFNHVFARYRPKLPLVVKDVNIDMAYEVNRHAVVNNGLDNEELFQQSKFNLIGKRIAIVGRTGAGKSSLVQLLLRLVNTTTSIDYHRHCQLEIYEENNTDGDLPNNADNVHQITHDSSTLHTLSYDGNYSSDDTDMTDVEVCNGITSNNNNKTNNTNDDDDDEIDVYELRQKTRKSIAQILTNGYNDDSELVQRRKHGLKNEYTSSLLSTNHHDSSSSSKLHIVDQHKHNTNGNNSKLTKPSTKNSVTQPSPTPSGISIDGIDIATIPLHLLRQSICVVPQEPILFSQSIRFNLAPEYTQTTVSTSDKSDKDRTNKDNDDENNDDDDDDDESNGINTNTKATEGSEPSKDNPFGRYSPFELGYTIDELIGRVKIPIFSQQQQYYTQNNQNNSNNNNKIKYPIPLHDIMLWRVLYHVQLISTIASLPQGLDYALKSPTHLFSLGQRQLLCLARTMLKLFNYNPTIKYTSLSQLYQSSLLFKMPDHYTSNSNIVTPNTNPSPQQPIKELSPCEANTKKILLLDEATSSVDTTTENMMNAIIRDITTTTNCTVISIAHHLHAILDYDLVIVMEYGNIVEVGHPKTLLSSICNNNVDTQTRFYKLVASETSV